MFSPSLSQTFGHSRVTVRDLFVRARVCFVSVCERVRAGCVLCACACACLEAETNTRLFGFVWCWLFRWCVRYQRRKSRLAPNSSRARRVFLFPLRLRSTTAHRIFLSPDAVGFWFHAKRSARDTHAQDSRRRQNVLLVWPRAAVSGVCLYTSSERNATSLRSGPFLTCTH